MWSMRLYQHLQQQTVVLVVLGEIVHHEYSYELFYPWALQLCEVGHPVRFSL